MNELSALETDQLLSILPTLLADERRGLVGFLVHLAEFDRRRGWETLGYGTLWDFCARELRLQKGSIFRRTTAVDLLQRFPAVEGRLLSGALTMTSLVEVKKIITADNCEEIIALAEWKSKDELKEIVNERMAPKVAPASMMRKLPVAVVSPPVGEELPATAEAVAVVRPAERGSVESTPLGDDRYMFRGIAGKGFREKLRRAQEIESHSVPDGDPIKVLERALDLLLEKHAKRVSAPAAKAEYVKAESKSVAAKGRHIPIDVERAVRTRDGDCCAYLLVDGTRCGSRWKTELDHVFAWANGGESSVANLRVTCRAHNALHARRTFGSDVVSRYGKRARPGSSGGTGGPPVGPG